MIVGVPKEIKETENHVALIPVKVEALVRRGHTVLVEAGVEVGSGIGDVAGDQSGCIETIRPPNPTYVVDGIIHCGVVNIPGAVPRTSTFALTNQTLPYIVALAEKGTQGLEGNPALMKSLNAHGGRVTYHAMAEAFGQPLKPVTAIESKITAAF